MITPWKEDNTPDFKALEALTNWYVEKGCDGIFAVCQSSEMHYLSAQEKLDIARCVSEAAAGRLQIVASGNTECAPHRAVPPDRGHDEDPRHRRVCARVQPDGHQKRGRGKPSGRTWTTCSPRSPRSRSAFMNARCRGSVSLRWTSSATTPPGGRLVFIKDTLLRL